MAQADEIELRALQARAYGRDADAPLDAEALRRLRQLEGKRMPTAASVPQPVEAEPALEPDPVPEGEPARAHAMPTSASVGAVVARRALAAVRRRPGILIAVAVIVAAAVVAAGLLANHPVQTPPLQAGATQVARLPIDPEYKLPGALETGESNDKTLVFEEFDGLRPF